MEYKNLSLDEILVKVDAKYTRQEQNNIAFELVDSLMDSTDDLDEDFDAYLSMVSPKKKMTSASSLFKFLTKSDKSTIPPVVP